MTIKATLLSMQDLKYKEFNDKLLADYEKPSVGIRLPALRLYAKQLIHTKTLDELLKEIDDQYVEEIMLKGILIGLDKNLSWETLRFISQII